MSTIDPVCGKELQGNHIVATRAYGALAFHFCSDDCAARFDADPTRYISHDPAAGALTGTTEDAHSVPQSWRDDGDLEGRPPGP